MFKSHYHAKTPTNGGFVHYTNSENAIWHDLYEQQIGIVQNRACDEFLQGLKTLHLSRDHIPQLHEMNEVLEQATGWHVRPVPALIPYSEFFGLLADCKFPAATFIRKRKDFKYIKEPDIFHEFFGHCPMITFPEFANFMQRFGEIAMHRSEEEQARLARLYWFTVEFGLIETEKGLRIYGGGILSSPEETVYALESPIPKRCALDVNTVLNTDFRIDIKQTQYFVIKDYSELYHVLDSL